MGRVAKKTPEAAKVVEESPSTVTLTRAKRTPKPNPKYANDSVIATPKAVLESSESNGSSDIEDKLPETKIVKSTKKVFGKSDESALKAKQPIAKAKSLSVIKKQKIEFDDDEKTKDADEVPPLDISPQPTPRATRSGKNASEKLEEKSEIKVGEESVSIVDVSSIIGKSTLINVQNQNSPKIVRGIGRKRPLEASEPAKEDSPKKKKEDERPSNISARKSYIQLPTVAIKKSSDSVTDALKEKSKEEDSTIEEDEVKEEVKTPVSTMKTRRNAATPQSAETVEKKPKLDTVAKTESSAKSSVEPKKLPMVKKEQITKVTPSNTTPTVTVNTNALPTKVNNATPVLVNSTTKPVTRILNSMVTPKGVKGTPNVKLAGDGTDKKVFSIEMSDGSIVEKKTDIVTSVKPSPAIKENVAINKPQPSVLLKNKLESELNRMKASASLMRRQVITNTAPAVRHSLGGLPTVTQVQNITPAGARRVTKFESWYVINVKNDDHATPKHTHTYSLTRLGNRIKEVQLPSTKWDYKVTLQRKQKKENNNEDDEVYTGNMMDNSIAASEKQNFEPSSILFKRSNRENNKVMIDRSLMLKGNMFAITMNGKQCPLLGAPNDIQSVEDVEILLQIIDSCNVNHSCVETC
jgi:hypothetical protein